MTTKDDYRFLSESKSHSDSDEGECDMNGSDDGIEYDEAVQQQSFISDGKELAETTLKFRSKPLHLVCSVVNRPWPPGCQLIVNVKILNESIKRIKSIRMTLHKIKAKPEKTKKKDKEKDKEKEKEKEKKKPKVEKEIKWEKPITVGEKQEYFMGARFPLPPFTNYYGDIRFPLPSKSCLEDSSPTVKYELVIEFPMSRYMAVNGVDTKAKCVVPLIIDSKAE